MTPHALGVGGSPPQHAQLKIEALSLTRQRMFLLRVVSLSLCERGNVSMDSAMGCAFVMVPGKCAYHKRGPRQFLHMIVFWRI